MRFWLGGYTADMKGQASGIGALVAGDPDGALAGGSLGFTGNIAVTDGSPSWIAAHPHLEVLYAALEGAGAVQAFRRTGESSFGPLGAPIAVGEAVCHVAVAPDGTWLVASCWGDGAVVRIALGADGRPSTPRPAVPATDPYADNGTSHAAKGMHPGVDLSGGIDLAAAARALRAAAGDDYAHLIPDHDLPTPPPVEAADPAAPTRVSRAHQAIPLPGGLIATTDMGLDLVRIWRVGAELALVQEIPLPQGSGPRHGVWHPSGHLYVVTELSGELFVLAPDETGRWRIVGGTSLSPVFTAGADQAAELAMSHDREVLYAGVRGSNTIAALRVRGDGARITPVALAETGTQWPRHHVVVRDTLLVAGERADEVVSLGLDLRTGVPGRVRHRAAAPSPTCLLSVRG